MPFSTCVVASQSCGSSSQLNHRPRRPTWHTVMHSDLVLSILSVHRCHVPSSHIRLQQQPILTQGHAALPYDAHPQEHRRLPLSAHPLIKAARALEEKQRSSRVNLWSCGCTLHGVMNAGFPIPLSSSRQVAVIPNHYASRGMIHGENGDCQKHGGNLRHKCMVTYWIA